MKSQILSVTSSRLNISRLRPMDYDLKINISILTSQPQHYMVLVLDKKCTNKEPYNDGPILDEFPCPMEAIPDHYGYCCGSSIYQYCCRREDT